MAAAAKKPAMPTMTKLAGCGTEPCGKTRWSRMPSAPPPQPPITIDGPNTPPEPPLPMVRPVVRILPSGDGQQEHRQRTGPLAPAGRSVRLFCRMP